MTTIRINPCRLCPRSCEVDRASGKKGYCGAGAEIRVARAALHAWEEPPISGQTGSGTIFFSHCPLRCVYCQNAELASGEVGWNVTTEELASIMRGLEAQGALNINLVTATHFAPQVIEAIAHARSQGMSLPILWNTSSYETVETIAALAGSIDCYLADFKYGLNRMAQRYSKAPDYPEVALNAIDAMVEQVGAPLFDEYQGQRRLKSGVVIRHLLLPGSVEESKEVLETLYGRYGDDVLYSLMNQYTPVMGVDALARFPELANAPTDDAYEELLEAADALGIEDYYWQEGGAVGESFIPTWDGTGVIP